MESIQQFTDPKIKVKGASAVDSSEPLIYPHSGIKLQKVEPSSKYNYFNFNTRTGKIKLVLGGSSHFQSNLFSLNYVTFELARDPENELNFLNFIDGDPRFRDLLWTDYIQNHYYSKNDTNWNERIALADEDEDEQ